MVRLELLLMPLGPKRNIKPAPLVSQRQCSVTAARYWHCARRIRNRDSYGSDKVKRYEYKQEGGNNVSNHVASGR
jgi:hypothetical protein